jgi:hypothetical protein
MNTKYTKIQTPQKKILRLQKEIAVFDVVCSGNLRSRTLICGKKNCHCKGKSPKLHGPYHYWSHRQGGKLVQKVLTPAQAKIVGRAIRNYRNIRRILERWEQETVEIIKI